MKVLITRTSGSPIHFILTSSYTTASMNLITWNKAYSIFPRQTLVNHRFYPLRSLDNGFGSHLNELAQLAWTTRDILWPDIQGPNYCRLEGHRRLGDRYSLVIPLNTESVQAPATTDFAIEYAQFDIPRVGTQDTQSGPGFSSPTQFTQRPVAPPQTNFPFGHPQVASLANELLHIQVGEVISIAVRHCYLTSSESWRSYLEKRLRRWAWLEIYKLEPENRPLRSLNVRPLVSDLPHFEVPQSWDFADDQIPIWYHEWNHQRGGKDYVG